VPTFYNKFTYPRPGLCDFESPLPDLWLRHALEDAARDFGRTGVHARLLDGFDPAAVEVRFNADR
jgi:hypothetical protein